MSNYGPPGGSQHGNPQEPWSGEPAQEPYETPSDPWGDAEQGRNPQTGQDQWSPGNDQWSGRQDQWHGADRWGGQPASTPPDGSGDTAGGGYPTHSDIRHGYNGPAQGYPDAYPTPEPARSWPPSETNGPAGKGNRTGAIVVLVTLAVLVLGSGGLAIYLASRDDPDTGNQTQADPTSAASAGPSAGPDTPLATPDAEPGPTTPGPRASADARFVTVGQCVANEGSVEKPALAITACGSGKYEVLQRFDGPTTGQDDAKEKCSPVEGYTDWYFFDSPFDALDYVLCLKLR